MKKTILKLASLFLAVSFLGVACNIGGPKTGTQKRVELTWWKPFADIREIQPLIEQFQKAYPYVTINYVQKDIETYEDQLVNALAGGEGPDIFSIHNDWLPKHQTKIAPAPDKIFPLRDYRDSFVQVAEQDFVSENKIYGIPLAMDVLALYYNKDILASAGIARPPATWEELVNLVPKITLQDSLGNFQRSAIALGTADNVNRAPDIFELLMLQNNTPLYSADNKTATFDQSLRDKDNKLYSPGARALEFYTQFATPAKTTYTWNSQSNNSIEAFSSGRVAMILSYAYLRQTLAEKAPFLNYGVASVPQIDSGAGTRINFANYWGESVAKQSPNQEVAWQFLKFISGKDILEKSYEVSLQPSSRIDILDTQLQNSDIGVFAENALSAQSVYKPNSDSVENILVQAINDVILRNIKPQEAISAATQKVNLLLRNF